ncbi:alpha-amylase family glycosyl hydrolase [Bradyrhizobium sp. USDA 4452]
MLLFTLKGTTFFYMGDEIARERVHIPPDRLRDPFEKLVGGYELGPDPERAPMRWDGSPNGGFTRGEPWLPLESNGARNVAQQRDDKRSVLQLYRNLIRLRQQHPCLQQGDYHPIRAEHDVLRFKRVLNDRAVLIGLTTSGEPRYLNGCNGGTLLLTTYLDSTSQILQEPTLLRANEGIVVELAV